MRRRRGFTQCDVAEADLRFGPHGALRPAPGAPRSDAATVRTRRYVEASANPTSVNDATVQYDTKNRPSARCGPRGWKKAVTNKNTSIMAQTTTPKRPSIM